MVTNGTGIKEDSSMKKIFFALSALAAIVAGCTAEPLPEKSETTPAKPSYTLIASMPSQSKTTIDDSGAVSWEEGDKIEIYDGDFEEFTLASTTETGVGIFEGDIYYEEDASLALYPAGIGSEVADEMLTVNLPSEYEYNGKSIHTPMLATALRIEDNTAKVQLKHMGGLFKITYENVPDDAAMFIFEATKQICGEFYIEDYTVEGAVIEAGDAKSDAETTVTYDIPADHPSTMSFYIPVPTGQFGFEVYMVDNNYDIIDGSSKKKNSITIDRGRYFNIPAITLPIVEKECYKRITSLEEYEDGEYIVVAHVYKNTALGVIDTESAVDYALPNSFSISSGKISGVNVTSLISNDRIPVNEAEPYKVTLTGAAGSIAINNGAKDLSYSSSTNLSTGTTNNVWTLLANDGNGGTFILKNNSTLGASTERALIFQVYTSTTSPATLRFGAYASQNGNSEDYAHIELYKHTGKGTGTTETHTANFSVNGSVVENLSTTVVENAVIPFPANPSVTGGTFIGWAKAAIDGVQDTAPSMVDTNSEKMGSEDVTFFAVFTTSGVERTSTWNISGVQSPTQGGKDVNTALKTSSVVPENETGIWTAVAPSSYAATSNQMAQLGSGSYKFAGTITLSGSSIPTNAAITQINLTATSNAADANPYTISATVNGSNFGSAQNLSSGNPDCQWGGAGVGNNIVLTTACGYNRNIVISCISVKYKLGGVGYCTIVPGGDQPSLSVASIAVKTYPTKTYYTEGNLFDPSGLVITVTHSDSLTEDIAYDDHKSDFSFTPGLSTALSTSVTSVQVAYGGCTANIPITVTAAQTGIKTWLDEYEIPAYSIEAISTSDVRYNQCYSHSTVSESYGGTKAAVYNTTNSMQKIVVHTFSYNSKILSNYAMLYDGDKKCALWAAYQYDATNYADNGVGRNEKWSYDPALPQSWQPLLSGSYPDSNYSRGHQVGSGDRQTVIGQNQQTFYYSNMTPQYTKLNTGQWGVAEDEIQKAVAQTTGTSKAYVVTGPLFLGTLHYTKDKGGKDCAIPNGFFKCVMRCGFDSNGNMTSAKGCAYIVETNSANTAATLTSIDYVESKTGFDLFANVPDALENAAEAQSSKFWN